MIYEISQVHYGSSLIPNMCTQVGGGYIRSAALNMGFIWTWTALAKYRTSAHLWDEVQVQKKSTLSASLLMYPPPTWVDVREKTVWYYSKKEAFFVLGDSSVKLIC